MSISSGSRIALTGATGFVGGHTLTHLLDQGYKVRALTRKPPERTHLQLEWIEGDLHNTEALERLVEGVDGVVHVAGTIKARRRRDFVKGNVTGTWNLLNVMVDTGVAATARYVHLSSLAARTPQISPYAATKAQAEGTVKSVGPGFAWTILRPPAVFGPGDRETFYFFKAAQSRLAVVPGAPKNRTSLIHVHDLARAIDAALRSDALLHQTIDVHDGAPLGYTMRDIITLMAKPDLPPPMIFVPGPVFQLVGLFSWLASQLTRKVPMLTPSKARELSFRDWVCADRQLFNQTDWRPAHHVNLGISQTRAWYEKEGWL